MTTIRILAKPAEGEEPEKLYYEEVLDEKKVLKVDLVTPIEVGDMKLLTPDPDAVELEIYVEEIKDELGNVIGREVLFLDHESNIEDLS